MNLLLKNIDILTKKKSWEVISQGWIGITDGKFSYIGKEKPPTLYDKTLDLSGCLAMPGMYNLHSHTPMSVLRGLGSHLPLERWLREAMFPIEAKMTREDINVGARIAIMEMIASGVVSFSDMYRDPEWYMDDIIQSGISANLTYPIMDYGDGNADKNEERIQKSIHFFEHCNGAGDGAILADFAIHAEYTSSDEITSRYSKIANERHGRIQLHLSETRKEHEECKQRHGKTPARWFYDHGVFDCPTIAAHCVWVEDSDLLLLKEKDVTVAHNPSSNMKLGSGFMPMRKMLDHGIRVTLGADGSASNNNQNMFEEMHLASLIHCGYQKDPTIITPDDVLTMATINGAAAQERPNCGNIQLGYQADLAILDLDKPHLMPILDVPSLLTYTAQASDVKMTIANGKIIYQNGEFLTIDADRVRFDLKQTVKRLFE